MSAAIDFKNLSYLQSGNPRQQRAHKAIHRLGILQNLKAFNPVLAGTIPIEIDIPGSDLDMLCEVHDEDTFYGILRRSYIALPRFKLYRADVDGTPSVVCTFRFFDIPFEIFGQPWPAEEQNAYLHMIIEHRILQLLGETFRRKVIRLKEQGMKTEPAFSQLLRLVPEFGSNPYEAIIELEELSPGEFKSLINSRFPST